MTPQELKNSILQLAIQGKLVEQRPEEGTGEELYQQIQAEKQRLIKEGKIKKEKPLPEISENEIPFDIPESWFWTKIESVTYTVGNRENQIQTKEILPEGDFPVVSQGQSLIDGYTNQREKVIHNLPLVMFGDHTRNVKYIDFPFVIGADGTKFHKCILVYPKFLYYWMIYASGQLRNRGYARHYVLLKQQLIPLPPLSEQERIVARIEELLPYIDRYERAWSKLEELNKRFPIDLQKSILQMAIQGKLVEQRPEEGTGEELYQQIQDEKQRLIKEGKIKKEKPLPEITEDEIPFDIPENWKWALFGELGNYKKGPFGSALTKDMFVPKGNGAVKVYEQKNAIQKNASIGDYYITREYFETKMSSFEVHPGDVIVSCAGTIGEAFVLPDNIEQGIINQALMRMRLFKPIYVPYFLMYFDVVLKQNARSGSKGSAIKNIPPFDVLKRYPVPLPPLAEQKRIVDKLEKILPLCEKLKK
jgi:type I restriction enzyme S subunit